MFYQFRYNLLLLLIKSFDNLQVRGIECFFMIKPHHLQPTLMFSYLLRYHFTDKKLAYATPTFLFWAICSRFKILFKTNCFRTTQRLGEGSLFLEFSMCELQKNAAASLQMGAFERCVNIITELDFIGNLYFFK